MGGYTTLAWLQEGESGVRLGWAPGTAAGGCQGDRWAVMTRTGTTVSCPPELYIVPTYISTHRLSQNRIGVLKWNVKDMVWVASLLLSSQVLQGYFLSMMGNCIVWTVNCLMNVTSSAAELLSLSIIVSKLEKVTHHWLSVVLWAALHCTGNWCRNAGPGGGGVMPHTVHPGSCTYTYTCTCPAMQLRHRTLYTLHIIQGSTCYGRFRTSCK